MNFLLIDTSTERGVIALGNSSEVTLAKDLPFGSAQSKYLIPFLAEFLHSLPFPPQLSGIGVGIGPGSYTGIRLGVSVAQALAYSWNIPLIGISSLDGFIPDSSISSYAAVIDARIGGVYFQKGEICRQGCVEKSPPQIASLEEIGGQLDGITHLVTPSSKSLQVKFKQSYPEIDWTWEERGPSPEVLLKGVEKSYFEGKITLPPKQLDLLYLRETEAERAKKNQN